VRLKAALLALVTVPVVVQEGREARKASLSLVRVTSAFDPASFRASAEILPFTFAFMPATLSSSASCPSSMWTFFPTTSAYFVPPLTHSRVHSAALLPFSMC
jgi:hypothetical protein